MALSIFAQKVADNIAAGPTGVNGISLQSSVMGRPIPILMGTNIVAPNLIWYGDFVATSHVTGGTGGGGGKGVFSGQQQDSQSTVSVSYTYSVALMFALCEGEIESIGDVYADKTRGTADSYGFSHFGGVYPQTPWSYLTTAHPSEAIPYSGVSYIAAASYALGTSPQLPNHRVETYGLHSDSVTGEVDADPSEVVTELLTNSHWGGGFPLAQVGDLSDYQSYCIATGLLVSPYYDTQQALSSMLDEIALLTNSEFVFSSGVLTIVPRGDEDVTGGGYTYTAPAAPEYDLTDEDFMPMDDKPPISVTRRRASDAMNQITLEALDRSNWYAPTPVVVRDPAMIDTYGLRPAPSVTAHLFPKPVFAQRAAQLLLQRQAVRNTYRFRLDARYILLDPMDIVSLTHARMGLDAQWVRILEIEYNDDRSLTFTAEEYLNGTGAAATYSFGVNTGFNVNYNETPDPAQAPVIIEPTEALAGGLEAWVAVAGSGSTWGGVEVWVSTDGATYSRMGRIVGPSRYGVTTSTLPDVDRAITGSTIDEDDTLGVSLAISGGELVSTTTDDALALNTLLYVGGEYISYATATLTGTNTYDLDYLVRGALGTDIVAHVAGEDVVRLDGQLVKIPFTQDRIGSTVYLKLLSFNTYGGGIEALGDVPAYTYTFLGTALSEPLADIINFTTVYRGGILELVWDEIVDFRPVYYEIRKGDAWVAAQILGRVAHPPFPTQGDGTYWIAAYSQPITGLQVYSANPNDLIVDGSILSTNIIATWDEEATGWTGTLGGSAILLADTIITTGGGDVFDEPDILDVDDIYFLGGEGDGTYEIPAAHVVNIGRIAACAVTVSWTSTGVPYGQSILDLVDFLGTLDLLGYVSSQQALVYPEIALSQGPDPAAWGDWQKFYTGSYVAQRYKLRMQLQPLDPNTIAALLTFSFSVDVPDRVDNYVQLSLLSGGTAITFTPDDSVTAAPFNGGPGTATLPNVLVTILNATAGDDAKVTGLTLSGCTVQITNGGVGVARTVNVYVSGY